VCTAYQTKEGGQEYLPYNISSYDIQPLYEELNGWEEDLTQLNEVTQFPKIFLDYIDYLEKALETPIKIVSVGPDRAQTIYR